MPVPCAFGGPRCISRFVITDATDSLLRLALAEDVGTGDRTTLATIPADTQCRARVVAKEPVVMAGGAYFARVFTLVDAGMVVRQLVPEAVDLREEHLFGIPADTAPLL